ncbi:MAG: hypothetical protein J3K34DRAFT_459188 [Monoraphidium minutum]|nr:MAG: hypothetical protein J3K34DRAFT_459188 [Monoraphidium minutum]
MPGRTRPSPAAALLLALCAALACAAAAAAPAPVAAARRDLLLYTGEDTPPPPEGTFVITSAPAEGGVDAPEEGGSKGRPAKRPDNKTPPRWSKGGGKPRAKPLGPPAGHKPSHPAPAPKAEASPRRNLLLYTGEDTPPPPEGIVAITSAPVESEQGGAHERPAPKGPPAKVHDKGYGKGHDKGYGKPAKPTEPGKGKGKGRGGPWKEANPHP